MAKGKGKGVKVKKVGDWNTARKTMPHLEDAYKKAQVAAVRREAEFFRKKVIECFKSGGTTNNISWASNSPMTIKRKGSSKPLIDKGDLIGSVVIKKVGPTEFFAGVPNNARGKNSTKLTSIGEVHEFGKVIVMKVTRKQQRFLMALIRKLGMGSSGRVGGGGGFRVGSILTIKIPERSFLRSTKKAHFDGDKSRKRIQSRISRAMRKAVKGPLVGTQSTKG